MTRFFFYLVSVWIFAVAISLLHKEVLKRYLTRAGCILSNLMLNNNLLFGLRIERLYKTC